MGRKHKSTYKKIVENKVCIFCGAFILLMSFCALFAPLIAPYPFYEQFPDRALTGPSLQHWLGTDHLGRDFLSRIIYGSRMSMAVGILTAFSSFLLALFYGLISGWAGGWTDRIMMRFVDLMFSIPALVLLILVKTVFDSFVPIEQAELKALLGTLIALTLISWAGLARVVRGQTLQAKEYLFIEASRSQGSGALRILFIHILPNILSPIIVLLSFQIPLNILYESMLSFLGLGLQPPLSSWGVLVDDGWRSLSSYPHLIVAPGLLLFLTVLAFNLFGDGLRDILDPQMR